MAKRTKNMRRLCAAAQVLQLAPDDVERRCRTLLEGYNSLFWLVQNSGQEVGARMAQSGAKSPEGAAVWLEWFAPGATRRQTKEQLRTLAAGRFLATSLEEAVAATENYPGEGADYAAILRAAYLNETPLPDRLIAAELHLERSTYYSRKREAVLCCGIILFGHFLESARWGPKEEASERSLLDCISAEISPPLGL